MNYASGGTSAPTRWPQGVFVSVDGLCVVGKSTTIRAPGERLRTAGLPPYLTSEPTDSEIGALARARAHDDTSGPAFACLIATDRYQDRYQRLETEIQPRQGTWTPPAPSLLPACRRLAGNQPLPPDTLASARTYETLTGPDAAA